MYGPDASRSTHPRLPHKQSGPVRIYNHVSNFPCHAFYTTPEASIKNPAPAYTSADSNVEQAVLALTILSSSHLLYLHVFLGYIKMFTYD